MAAVSKSAQKQTADQQAVPASEQPGDSITLSRRARALLKLQEDQPALRLPGSAATAEERSNFSTLLNNYEAAQETVDDTQLSQSFQSYVDIINDPKADDDQKLGAYSRYRLESVLADTSFERGYQMSDQDFKFEWLTRNSDFMTRVNSGDVSLYYRGQAELKASSKTGLIDRDKDTANLIDVGAGMTHAQQGVIAINVVSTNLMAAIMNGDKASHFSDPAAANVNRTPGFMYTGSKPIDLRTAVAQAVFASLHALSLSHAGSATDVGGSAYREFFTQTVQSFARQATSRGKAPQ